MTGNAGGSSADRKLAVRYAPDIALAIGLQAFGGLRPGEVCNVRQEGSPKGAGILFTFVDGRLVKAEFPWLF